MYYIIHHNYIIIGVPLSSPMGSLRVFNNFKNNINLRYTCTCTTSSSVDCMSISGKIINEGGGVY